MQKKNSEKKRVVAVSGGFDPIHIGHVRLFKAARALGDYLVVIMNNDNWLRKKKGFVFMPEQERAEIIREFPFVDEVVTTAHTENDEDSSVVREIERVHPDVFANGGDRRNEADIPETIVCKRLGIEMVFNVGHGGKVSSSSNLAEAAAKAISKLHECRSTSKQAIPTFSPARASRRASNV
ncbi:MAG: adenylyltransferase/cytidyltransferase family protein [bacterium]|nr:adenylyltransferase/cytidyltransferase family protein [bacterium]